MKRFLIHTTLLFLLAGALSSCKKKIEQDYLNPELTTTGSMSKLLSGIFLNERIHPSYWNYYTFIQPTTGGFSQFTALVPAAQMYVPSLAYNESRWVDFYDGVTGTDYNYSGPGIMSTYREMQTTFATLPASKQDQEVFLRCAQVILYDQASQMIDLWGDIPFSAAGSLNTSARTVIKPAFDNAASLYDTLIAGLQDLNTYFANANLSPATQTSLVAADILLNGDLSLWRRYANSLRLRLLMRISFYKEAAAQTMVTAMLNDPATYPLITSNAQNVQLNMSPTAFKSDMLDALSGSPYAPAYLLDTLMVANSDPRIDVFWDANKDSGFAGFPFNGTVSQYEMGKFATYDSATFFYNYNLPGVIFNAAEVSFLKAEAEERWELGAARTDYENGIKQSIEFYFGINHTRILRSGTFPILPSPTPVAISNYIAMPAISYTGTTTQRLAKIWTQKWIHFFILEPGQAWAELRRTHYPVLSFAKATLSGATDPPVRLLYPSSEKLFNTTNYASVSAKDTRDTKIFWDVR